MTRWIAYFQGQFVSADQVKVSADDLGFLQGVAISERLRTFGGSLFRLEDHLDRLRGSLAAIQLKLNMSFSQLGRTIQEVADRNRPLLASGDDLGIALFVTPGVSTGGQPTIGIEAYPLPFGQWADLYEQGQALSETCIRQVPANCWPPFLKCRSRMHYFLADQLADGNFPGSRAVLLDQDGFVTEVSTANIVIYREQQGFISPPRDKILPGVSLIVLQQLATKLRIPFQWADIRLDEVADADEVLLCSTSPCLWPVSRLNGREIGANAGWPIFHQCLDAWSDLVGMDIVDQAKRFRSRG